MITSRLESKVFIFLKAKQEIEVTINPDLDRGLTADLINSWRQERGDLFGDQSRRFSRIN